VISEEHGSEHHGAAAATILSRLWGALAREPVPGVAGRSVERGVLTVRLVDGTVVSGDAATARPFAHPENTPRPVVVTRPDGRAPAEQHEPGELVRALGDCLGRHGPRFAAELDNSVANVALARAAQPAPDGGAGMLARAAAQPDPLVFFEQSVVDGHPLHPCARTRTGLDPDQVRAYAPEHRPPPVCLRSVAVPRDRWYGVNCPPRLWLHPYQYERHVPLHPWLSPVGREIPAQPLMSLRTLALVGEADHHVKTAVDIQMTSAVRGVSAESLHNGVQLSALLAGHAEHVPGLRVLPDVGGGAVTIDGEPQRSLAVNFRRVPPLAPGECALPLGALCAPSLATGAPLVAELVADGYGRDALAFVDALATVLLRPVFGWLELGVALEAHGQNVLAVIREARLVGLLYRDFGGVRVSPRRLGEHGIEPGPLRGDIPTDDPEVLRAKVIASAVSTVLAEVIATLGRTAGVDEDQAWQRVATIARTIPGPDAPHLFDETLPLKALTAMRLAQHPTTDLWCGVPNPMAGLR
jgi:siderophore synthetase component